MVDEKVKYEAFKEAIESLEREHWDNGWSEKEQKAYTAMEFTKHGYTLDKPLRGLELLLNREISNELGDVLMESPYTRHLMIPHAYLDEKENTMKESVPFWDRVKDHGTTRSPKDWLRLQWIAQAWENHERLQEILSMNGGVTF
jgi:hypothetical protein